MPFVYVLPDLSLSDIQLTCRISQTKVYLLGMLITLNLRKTPTGYSGAGTEGSAKNAHALKPVTETVRSSPLWSACYRHS
jgi:hypothetical protein